MEVTPADRFPFWKKKWGTSRPLDDAATEAAFDEFLDNFVPTHMRKQFLKLFWSAKPKFANRFFVDEAAFFNWDTRFRDLVHTDQGRVEATVLYGSPEEIEAHVIRGELRRTLRDVVVDDWRVCCAIARTEHAALYIFTEPKMKGCVVRIVSSREIPKFVEPLPGTLIEHDE